MIQSGSKVTEWWLQYQLENVRQLHLPQFRTENHVVSEKVHAQQILHVIKPRAWSVSWEHKEKQFLVLKELVSLQSRLLRVSAMLIQLKFHGLVLMWLRRETQSAKRVAKHVVLAKVHALMMMVVLVSWNAGIQPPKEWLSRELNTLTNSSSKVKNFATILNGKERLQLLLETNAAQRPIHAQLEKVFVAIQLASRD